MIYKTNTPNYKNKNVTNFSDFLDSIESEKENLKDIKKGFNPNNDDTQKYPKNSKLNFNTVTRKMDDITLDDVNDKLENLKESSIDSDIFIKITNKDSYKKLISDMRKVIDEYIGTLEDTGFDEGDNDHYMALSTAISEACNTAIDL
jgi:GTP-binding protein EngB required for normal cell division